MAISIVVSALLGAIAARSIVAEADAHRQDLSDRWFGPVCTECGSPLTVTLLKCGQERHMQRFANGILLASSIVISGALPPTLPSLWLLPAYLVFAWSMILLTVTDLDTKLLPNRILGPATAVGSGLLILGHLLASDGGGLISAAIGAVSYFLVLLLLALLVKGGLGFGDVKLAFLIGTFTGYLGLGHVVVAGVGAFILGGFTAAFLLITRRSGRKDAIPFGPFMTAAGILTIFFGQVIVDWYVR